MVCTRLDKKWCEARGNPIYNYLPSSSANGLCGDGALSRPCGDVIGSSSDVPNSELSAILKNIKF